MILIAETLSEGSEKERASEVGGGKEGQKEDSMYELQGKVKNRN